jgi:hypothetical protein
MQAITLVTVVIVISKIKMSLLLIDTSDVQKTSDGEHHPSVSIVLSNVQWVSDVCTFCDASHRSGFSIPPSLNLQTRVLQGP